jgi:uncharacterized protein YbjT (DUF2867 family)
MNVLITGSSGMVGRSVLNECLESDHVDRILLINRKSIQLNHPKVREILLADFTQIDAVANELKGVDACFHCMGVSSVGISEEDYFRLTYTVTEVLAKCLYQLNNQMVFNYVSGTGTDRSEQGRITWANVKRKTENMVFGMRFKDAYAFRPGAIIPEKGVKSRTGLYNALYFLTKPLFPILRKLDSITTSSQLGQAMINSVLYPQELKILENREINQLATK